MSQVAFFIGPFIPDSHTMLVEVPGIGISFQKPEQFMDDGFEVQFFGSHQRETIGQVKSHLVAKRTQGAGPRPVFLSGALVQDMGQ
jgi:hypothetical protein